MGNLLAGGILIGIGLVRGDSVFYGDFSALTVLFDALGAFFLIKGVLALKKSGS